MIADLARFLETERPCWQELEALLDELAADPACRLGLDRSQRLLYLYERSSSALAQLRSSAVEPAARELLEPLVARAYGEIHAGAAAGPRFRPFDWLLSTFPATFRRHIGAFCLALAVTAAGAGFGAGAVLADPEARSVIMPFPGLLQDPAERVRQEERSQKPELQSQHASFSAELMSHNIRVSFTTLAAGISWGLGTLIVVFFNGIALGAVAADYVRAGQTTFLLGWLLPHGVIEIPAILIAAQGGFVLARALIGRGERVPRSVRLRAAAVPVATLAGGAAVLLVWAGIVESFLSQYHQPVLPYAFKIGFGLLEAAGLALFLYVGGRRSHARPPAAH